MKAKVSLVFIMVLVLSSFILSSASGITMDIDKENYVIGESITVTFEEADGDTSAWFAIYPVEDGDKLEYEHFEQTEKVWLYANSGTETPGEGAATSGSITLITENLVAGEYRITYFPNGGYDVGKTIVLELVEESTEEGTETNTEEDTNPPTSDTSFLMPIVFICTTVFILLKRKEILL